MDLIYDNIVYSLQNFGGISTYWYELSYRALADPSINIDFVESKNDFNNILRHLLAIPDKQLIKRTKHSLSIERFLRVPIQKNTPANTIFHSSYFRLPAKSARIRKVCTVHDFIHDKFHKGPRVVLHNFSKRKCILESDLIITVSENTKKDLLEYYPSIDPGTVIPVYNGVSNIFKPLTPAGKTERPFLLFIGARYAYKNFKYAVELTALSKDYLLYIVGAPLNNEEQTFINQQLGQNYKCFTGVSIEDLNVLYNKAFCLLYPSSYEGFGIPLLEAMAAGCPFIALNSSSIPEVAGNAGVMLKTLEHQEGLKGLESIALAYETYRQKGIERVKLFSWDKCYADTMKVYKKILPG